MAEPEVFRPISSTTMCEVRYQHGTNLLENTFYWGWAGAAPSAAELLSLAQNVGATIGLKMGAIMHNGVIFREVYCRNMDTQVANQATALFSPGTTGQRAGGPLASNEACGVIKRSGLTGRKRRNRNSFSEFVEGDADGNTIGGTLMSLIANLALELLVQRIGTRFTAAVASRSAGNSVPMTQALTLDSNVDSQKTRLNSHGN